MECNQQGARAACGLQLCCQKQSRVCMAGQLALHHFLPHYLTWSDFPSCMGLSPTAESQQRLWMNLDPLGHSTCPPGRTIPRLASNIPPIKCFTSPNQTLKSESSCPLNSSRGLTASFNFLVQRNWNSS